MIYLVNTRAPYKTYLKSDKGWVACDIRQGKAVTHKDLACLFGTPISLNRLLAIKLLNYYQRLDNPFNYKLVNDIDEIVLI